MSGYIGNDIAGYEGRYAVTESGRVWSYFANKWLKPVQGHTGYMHVCLYSGETPKDYLCKKVHRLVAETFLGGGDGLEVNHIDGDKSNNALSNLEWVTSSENKRHAWAIGLRGGADDGLVKHHRKSRRLSRDAVITIRQMKQDGWSAGKIAKIAGINRTSVFKIANGQSYKEVV